MKKIILLIISSIIGMILFAAVIFTSDIKRIINIFEIFSFYKYLIVLIFYIVIYLITLARWGMILDTFGYHIPFTKLLSMRLSEWTFGYLTPFARLGGEPVMVYLFKKECNIKYRKGIAIIILNKVLDFTAALSLCIVGITFFAVFYNDMLPKKATFLLALTITLLSMLTYLFYIKIKRKKGFFSMFIKAFKNTDVHNGILLVENELYKFFKKHKKKIISSLCISFIIAFMTLISYKILAVFIGANLSLAQVLIVFTFLVIAFILPIPGSLGSMEGSMALAFVLMGFSAGQGVAFALILRSCEFILTGIGSIFLSYYGIKLKGP
ncbi:MAG: lysylphosphatidylglycerol synthase transmembrane domain-containing protein [Candidatus Pacearchaeota archaeon]